MLKNLILLLTCSITLAHAEWIDVDRDDEFIVYADPNRITETNSTLHYVDSWFKYVVHTDKHKDGLSIGDHRLVKYRFKCDDSEIGLLALYDYHRTNLINAYTEKYVEFDPVIPESRGERLINIVCHYLYNNSDDNPAASAEL